MAAKYPEEETMETETKEKISLENETRQVFDSYMAQSLRIDIDKNLVDPSTPGVEKFKGASKKSKAWKIGQQLSIIAGGIHIDDKYDELIKQLAGMIDIRNGDDGFSEFAGIAQSVISNRLSWESITSLFRFGYLIARHRLCQRAGEFLDRLFQWFLKIFNQRSIFQWIAEHGGWDALLQFNLRRHLSENRYVYATGLVGIMSIAALFLYRRSK